MDPSYKATELELMRGKILSRFKKFNCRHQAEGKRQEVSGILPPALVGPKGLATTLAQLFFTSWLCHLASPAKPGTTWCPTSPFFIMFKCITTSLLLCSVNRNMTHEQQPSRFRVVRLLGDAQLLRGGLWSSEKQSGVALRYCSSPVHLQSFQLESKAGQLNWLSLWSIGFFFFVHTQGMWKFLGQGLNLHHSSDPGRCSDNVRSLTFCATGELLKHWI